MKKESDVQGQKPWVLFVEDDAFTGKMYSAKFAQEGIPIKIVGDGEKALELLKGADLPALVFLDLILPKKNGFEVFEDIKKDSRLRDLPVLILSNLAQKSDVDRGLSLGAKEYLIKTDLRVEDIVKKTKQYLQMGI